MCKMLLHIYTIYAVFEAVTSHTFLVMCQNIKREMPDFDERSGTSLPVIWHFSYNGVFPMNKIGDSGVCIFIQFQATQQ